VERNRSAIAQTGRRERRPAVARAIEDQLGFLPQELDRAAEVRHTVTYRRLRIAVWSGIVPSAASLPGPMRRLRGDAHLWIGREELGQLPVAAASHKALAALRDAQQAARPDRS